MIQGAKLKFIADKILVKVGIADASKRASSRIGGKRKRRSVMRRLSYGNESMNIYKYLSTAEDQIKSSTPVSVKSVENNSVETSSQDEDTWTEPLDIVTDEETETWFITKMLERQ